MGRISSDQLSSGEPAQCGSVTCSRRMSQLGPSSCGVTGVAVSTFRSYCPGSRVGTIESLEAVRFSLTLPVRRYAPSTMEVRD
jgi:hypothetical protein